MKKLVAYSSIAHLGFVMLGLLAVDLVAWQGSLLQMVNHGLSTGALFLLVGMLYDRRHTKKFDEFGGLAKVMPVFAFFLVFSTLASVGLPALNGFAGEFLILIGSFRTLGWPAVARHLRRGARRDLPAEDDPADDLGTDHQGREPEADRPLRRARSRRWSRSAS